MALAPFESNATRFLGPPERIPTQGYLVGIAEVIPRQDLTEVRLSAVIRKVLGTAHYQEEAARIAARLQGHDAVASACARIEEFMDENSSLA